MARQTGAGGTDGRYGSIETRDGEVVVYDRQDSTAWLQSDYTLEVTA
jgi:hypothetical protein